MISLYNYFIFTAGAKIDTLNKERSTAFLTATAAGHAEVVNRFLLHCKVPRTELNYALHTAVEFNHEPLVHILVAAGADPNFEVQVECKALGEYFFVCSFRMLKK